MRKKEQLKEIKKQDSPIQSKPTQNNSDVPKDFFGKTSLRITFFISIASFAISGYLGWNEIFKKASLISTINYVSIMPFPETEKEEILISIFHDDLERDTISSEAIKILKGLNLAFPDAIESLRKMSHNAFKNALINKMVELKNDSIVRNYNPPSSLIVKYLGSKNLLVYFYIPLTITNYGNKVATITSLYLEVKSKRDISKKWYYNSIFEIETSNLKKVKTLNTWELMGKWNSGYSILPNSSQTINSVFMHPEPNKIQENIKEGEYLIKIFAYSDENEIILETEEQPYELINSTLINAFRNGKTVQWIYNPRNQIESYNKKDN